MLPGGSGLPASFQDYSAGKAPPGCRAPAGSTSARCQAVSLACEGAHRGRFGACRCAFRIPDDLYQTCADDQDRTNGLRRTKWFSCEQSCAANSHDSLDLEQDPQPARVDVWREPQ